jgi:hypothetical protein
MKNVFKFFSIALAGALMFTACKPTEEPTPETTKYTITVQANDNTMGTVTGGGTYAQGTSITITATPNEGYKFVKWQDNVTEPSRTIIVNKDEAYTATFESNAPADGINVTFGSDQWTAGYAGIPFYSSHGVMNIIAFKSQDQSYPSIDILAVTTEGTHSEDAGENGLMAGTVFYNVDYYSETSLFTVDAEGDTTYYGDWWAKTATINTTSFDPINMKVTTVINATMFDALGALVNGQGIANAATKTMNVSVGNYDLISTGMKSAVSLKKNHGKLFVK